METELVICDSNTLIDVQRSVASTIEEVEKIGFENALISSITFAEILAGVKNKDDFNRTVKN